MTAPVTESRAPAETRERLRAAAEALAAMGEAPRLPEDWQARMARYREALRALLVAEGLA
jgi:hypothetical protein